MKVDKTKVKSKSSSAKFSKTSKVVLGLILVVAVVLALNIISSFSLRQTVDIVKLKSAVPQDGRITADNLVKDTMIKSEYEKVGIYTMSDGSKKRAIILWEDKDRIINAYASYYIRQGTPVYWDSLSKETPKQFSYLYKMDGELLKLDIKADQFGEMLVPGDKINVRAAYTEQIYTLPDEQSYLLQQQTGIEPQTSITEQILLFNNTTVLDILNGQGESIYDIYYNLLALPKSKQLEALGSDEFQDKVKPSQILLNVTPEEADNYMSIQSKGPSYMMTLLPRTNGNLITEALNELQTGLARQQSNSK